MNLSQFRTGTRIKKLETDLTNEMKHKFMTVANGMVEGFVVNDDLRPKLGDICKYFLGVDGRLNLNKGIYLKGSFGVGKTTLMMIIRKWLADYWPNSGNGFMVTSVEDIIQTYKMENSLDRFVGNSDDSFRPGARHLMINEFGVNLKDKIYGVESQIVITSRSEEHTSELQSH